MTPKYPLKTSISAPSETSFSPPSRDHFGGIWEAFGGHFGGLEKASKRGKSAPLPSEMPTLEAVESFQNAAVNDPPVALPGGPSGPSSAVCGASGETPADALKSSTTLQRNAFPGPEDHPNVIRKHLQEGSKSPSKTASKRSIIPSQTKTCKRT